MTESGLARAFHRILTPLARVAVTQGGRFAEAAEALKLALVDACETHFQLNGKRLTDSRVSLLTGLQRRDVRALRARVQEGEATAAASASPHARVVAHWMAREAFQGADGAPAALPRKAEDGSSFEALVAGVSRDMHARTILDELTARGVVAHDAETDMVSLLAPGYLPSGEADAAMSYFADNLGDHLEAAAANLAAPPGAAPFFERAVHYNKLSQESLETLEERARRLQQAALQELSALALELQTRDMAAGAHSGRFRCGAFVYRCDDDGAGSPGEAPEARDDGERKQG